jgi:hypothetical protein
MSFKKFLQNSGDFIGNSGKFSADMLLSTLGADNVIDQDSYSGKSKQAFQKTSNIAGSIYKGVAPIAAGAAGFVLGGPQGAQIGMQGMKGIQGVGGSLNPEDNRGGTDSYLESQQTGNQANQGLNQIGQLGIGALGMMGGIGGNTKEGGIPGMGTMYRNGGIIPNAEVELQENSIAPNGEFTQYDGVSHEQGGIPTNLKPGEMIFSDKLKLGRKTFADLNKANNTNKEDKVLEDIKSNGIAKSTAELMKQVKLKNSMALFNEQEALKQSKLTNYAKRLGINIPSNSSSQEQFGNGGTKGNPKYDPSFKTITERPANNDDFVTTDLNNLNPNVLKPQGFEYVSGSHKTKDAIYKKGNNYYMYGEQPVDGKVQYGLYNRGSFQESKPIVNNTQIKKQPINIQDPMKQIGYNGILAPITETYRKGGMYPKYGGGGFGPEENNVENMQMQNWALGTSPIQEDIREPITNGIDMSNIDSYQSNFTDANNSQSNNPNYGKMLTQLGLGLSQNAGNLYDLKNAKNVEVENYQRVNPSLLDVSAELQYNNNQGKLAVEDLRNASNGNSSTYIQNRKDLALNQMLTNSRITQSNNNSNAQIKNRAGEVNANIDMAEKNANAMNRAKSQDLKSNAYRQMGSNINSQYKDNQMANRDTDILKMIAMKNPQAANDPALLALFKKYGITY